MESKYLARFQKLKQGQFPLRSNRVLIEVIPKEEFKSKGGLILQTDNKDHKSATEMNRGELGIVLAVGDGYYDDSSKSLVPLDVKVGNIVMIGRFGLEPYSQIPGLPEFTEGRLAMVAESQVIVAWPTIEAYSLYRETLNS